MGKRAALVGGRPHLRPRAGAEGFGGGGPAGAPVQAQLQGGLFRGFCLAREERSVGENTVRAEVVRRLV